ncbi:Fur family transcriptional regulator [Paraburkholderia hospita]|uniref:Fur family transcriptional regulator n=1 Tax=Paraburkholderia hospita TaxID=169430 RepID=UPI0009A854F1|nr:transcriptional repressor [Paraburkholderia hospita]SKC74448.1 Fe2+ or Zn2+ uptake regulation protein [Paraburkholderia hospita]
MAPHDEPSRIIDLITSFGSKSSASPKRMQRTVASVSPETNDSKSSHEHRLAASHLRPTIARTSVLDALEKAVPRCLDASQVYRILNSQFEGLTSATIYRALNDLWTAGLLVRTEGAHGRAFYALKPNGQGAHYDTLRCHCAARLVFIADRTLREHLRALAAKEGFDLGDEPAFTVTVMCADCRQPRKRGR